ncbi:anti-sigma factor [Virgibacillus oceani]|uniref:Anti-sigma-W factor RsiW n=1 Tax=Virgibacillus oceani TaxID=1479511 RepID=A0A917M9X4_9BACI|nr:anti-sigma factor [Virgibacillus oceani]GGG88466.1 hypothetical protein GCM10011398_38080 [Virgibacillus oceani]
MTKNSCDVLLDYFNDQLTCEERKEFEAHLQICKDCQDELKELQELTADLPYSSEPIEPSAGMRERVLSNVLQAENSDMAMEGTEAEKNKTSNERVTEIIPGKKVNKWYKPLVAAVLVLSLIGNGAAIIYINQDEDVADSGSETIRDTIQRMEELQPSEGVSAQATAMMIEQNKNTNLVVQASDLPPLEGEETYQVWVVEDGKPYRAGTFVPNNNGLGAVSYVINYEGNHKWDTIAITKEPTANSKTPQGNILLSSPL